MSQTIESPKRPAIDLVGTYRVEEPTQKVNPKDGLTYEVPRGDYPVMGLLSADGKKIDNAGIIFSANNPQTGERVDVVERLRPIDIPALVQRQAMTMEATPDKALKFPMSMFLGEAPAADKKQSYAQEISQERKQSKSEDQGHDRKMSVSR